MCDDLLRRRISSSVRICGSFSVLATNQPSRRRMLKLAMTQTPGLHTPVLPDDGVILDRRTSGGGLDDAFAAAKNPRQYICASQ